jgi:1-acyl-sn-glycerol-3-phosphate acyltransferase
MTATRVSWRTAPTVAVGITATATAAAFLCCRPARSVDRGAVDRVTRGWAAAFLRAAGAHVTVRGTQHIERGQAYLVVCNHQSSMDAMALLHALPLSLRFLAKTEMFRTPVLGHAMRAAGMVEVDRKSPDLRQINESAGRCLRAGQSLLVFPEGTTSGNGKIDDFKSGAFALAIANQVPVLPVTIDGTRHIWRPGRKAIHSGRVRVLIGRPVPVAGLSRRDTRGLRDLVRDTVITAHRDLTASGARS